MYANNRPAVIAPSQQIRLAHARALALSGGAPSGPRLRKTFLRVRWSNATPAKMKIILMKNVGSTSLLDALANSRAVPVAAFIQNPHQIRGYNCSSGFKGVLGELPR